MLKIVQVPNAILNKPTKPIKNIDSTIHTLIKEMILTLEAQDNPKGVGLAANQVGKSVSLFIMKPDEDGEVTVFINPKIITRKNPPEPKNKNKDENELEGCLSIPKIWAKVNRDKQVEVSYTDSSGANKTQWFKGFESAVVQHEIDHLHGILFTQRSLEQGHTLYIEKNGKLVPKEL